MRGRRSWKEDKRKDEWGRVGEGENLKEGRRRACKQREQDGEEECGEVVGGKEVV